MTAYASHAQHLAGLYLRLSEKDKDEERSESESIENQRKLLLSEAKKRGFHVVDCYVDDGFTGTNFNRPGFERMIADIESQKINTVMTKDLSRFGRNYAQAGYYQEEYFPQHRIRYLAVLDGYDSDNEYSTTSAPWMNVANEQYARDTSRKIRGALRAKMEAGQFVGAFAPYGYQKHPDNKNQLIIDADSASVVRRIFAMLLEEKLPSEIANVFNAERIPTPSQYRCMHHRNLDVSSYSMLQEWTASIITKISRNREYTGEIVHNRQSKVSYKSKAYLQNGKEKWIINEAAHEPIIPYESFEAVQRIKGARKRRGNTGFSNLFAGFAFCADCHSAMSASPTRKWQEGVYNLSCGAYKLYGTKKCSNHFISYEHLKAIVYGEIACAMHALTQLEWEEIAGVIQFASVGERGSAAKQAARVNELAKRAEEIDQIIQKLYEDNLRKKLSDARFEKMLQSYEEQQEQVKRQSVELKRLTPPKQNKPTLQERMSFLDIAKQVILPSMLTRDLLFAYVDKILVHQGCYETIQGEKVKRQKIEVYLKYLCPDRQQGMIT